MALLFLTLTASLAYAKPPKMSKELAEAPSGSKVDVIVQFTKSPTAYHFNKVLARGGTMKRNLHGVIKGAAFSVPTAALARLAEDPDITYISADRPVHATASSYTLDYHTATVNAPYAWGRNHTGAGIGIALIDSGMAGHPDLDPRVVYRQDFTPANNPADQYGHGTHVAGILAGTGNRSTGANNFYTFKGIAPQANLINLRVLDQNGSGTDSEVIAAINQAISLKSKYNIRVINLSLGRPVYESYQLDPLCQAVEAAWKAGIVVVVAAGNDGRDNSAGTNGYGTITVPGNDPYVITVGAMKTMSTPSRADDLIASYSSKGPTMLDHVVKPDLVAPGNNIISTYKNNLTLAIENRGNQIPLMLYQSGNPPPGPGGPAPSPDYFMLSGTSMAAPMVSGAAALMLQQNPSLTPDQVKARLMKTASKNFPQSSVAVDPVTGLSYTSQYDIFTVGAGYLDIQAALSNTDLAPAVAGSALSPTVTQDANGNTILVDGSSVIWGNSILWGNSVVWGTSVLWGNNVSGQSVLWGSSVCWGASTVQGYSVVWGTSVVWSTAITDAGEAAIVIYGEN